MKNQQINSNGTPSVEDGMVSISLDGVIKEWNRGAEKIFGYSAEEAVGKSISLILCEEVFKTEKAIVRNLKKDLEQQYEAECKDKNDKKIFVSFTAFPVKDKTGKVNLISQVVKDITAQKIAEEKQATLAAIVNFSDDAIISKTLDGIITSWNPSATKLFGFTEKQALGKHISIIIPKDRLDEETVIINHLRKGKRIEHFETIRVAKDGTERNISLTVSPLKNRKGKIIGASKIARDISVRIEAEKQRELYTERLQELNNYKDDFMVMASHELKTPLTVILANLHILEMKMEDHPSKDFLIKTTRQVNKLSGLITSLLDVSKIQAGKLALNPTLFDMNILIKEISNNLQQTTRNHHIAFHSNHKKLMVRADHERIEQVIVNIISNAIKYSPESDNIVIEATKKNGYILVDVYDNGIGIPDKDIENIFLRFYRVSGSASSFSGSGVGLYISSEIIKHHGGEIWAESEIKKGSVFHFTIPTAQKLS